MLATWILQFVAPHSASCALECSRLARSLLCLYCSAMATSIAALCATAGANVAMGTALTWLAFATFTVGLCIIAVGKQKLATLVRLCTVRWIA